MKYTLPLYLLLALHQIGYAQENRIQISLSGGLANSSGKEKDHFIGNGNNLQGELLVPFLAKAWNGKPGGYSLGLVAAGNFTRLKNIAPNNNDVEAKYQVYNTEVAIDSRKSKAMSNNISGLLGIQAQFTFGKFMVSPGFSSGYMKFDQEGFTQTGSTSVNGQQQQKVLISRDREDSKGLVLKPQLKVGYAIANNISVFASTAIVSGPEIKTTTYYLLPQGGFKENNTYEISQLANGTMAASTNSMKYHATELNIGLSISIGKNRKTNQSIKKGTGAVSSSYARQAMPGNPIGGIIVKGGKNPGGNNISIVSDENGVVELPELEPGSYLFQLTAPGAASGKSISEKGVKKSESAEMARPGNPIGGIIVKGGKNPGGNNINVVSNSNGEILLDVVEAGSYKLVLYNTGNPPADPKKKTKEKKKVKEGAAPGLKDVIKTQV